MKSLKLITGIILFSAAYSFAQTTPAAVPATPAPNQQLNQAIQAQPTQQPVVAGQPIPKMNHYMVQIPHTKEQCETVKNQMKEKTPLLMRFEWSCAAGEHNGYAVLTGQSEDDVRKQLPEGVQKMAKIVKVDRANAGPMQQMHK